MKKLFTQRPAVCLAGGLCLGFALLTGFDNKPLQTEVAIADTIAAKQVVDILHPDYKSNPLQPWEEKFSHFGFYAFKRNGEVLPYRFYKPRASNGKKYPLVLFMHGAGERGADNRRQFLRFNPFSFWRKDLCYVLAPQCPEISATGRGDDNVWVNTPFNASYHTLKTQPTWPLQLTMALVDSLIATGNIDTKRIYITGLSMGAFATWEILHRKPNLFAAAMPVCGGADTATAATFTKTPLWVFHGNADDIVPEACSADMVQAIRRAGGKPTYTVLPGVGHNAWDYAYPQADVWKWMFAQRNK